LAATASEPFFGLIRGLTWNACSRLAGRRRDASKPRYLPTPQLAIETLDEDWSHQVELLRPHRRGARNRDDAAALRHGLCLRGDRGPDSRGPDGLDRTEEGLRRQIVT
jgi:hypothetical protein